MFRWAALPILRVRPAARYSTLDLVTHRVMSQPALTIEKQKRYLLEHSHALNRATQLQILTTVMMEVGKSVVLNPDSKQGTLIHLDLIPASQESVITLLYNIAHSRIEALGRPMVG